MDIDQNTPITWIEILPKDCIRCIRYWISKHDFSSVLKQLEIATNSERKWISDCEAMETYYKHGSYYRSFYQGNGSFSGVDPYITAIPSINNVCAYIVNNFSQIYNQQEPVTYNNLIMAFESCNDHHYSGSFVFEKLWEFIESEIGAIHRIIAHIKNIYKQDVAVPMEFATRFAIANDHFAWTDTKASFSRYIMEDAMLANYRMIIYNLLKTIQYNCGHMRIVRYHIENCKAELYRIDY
jgi:hypothetical protein